MPHVTFVHGIGNKPPAEQLSGIWRGALAANGLDLDARGVSSSMVYWADLLNAKPLAESQLEAADDPELATVPYEVPSRNRTREAGGTASSSTWPARG